MTLIQSTLVGLADRLQLVANIGVGMVIVGALICCAAYWMTWR